MGASRVVLCAVFVSWGCAVGSEPTPVEVASADAGPDSAPAETGERPVTPPFASGAGGGGAGGTGSLPPSPPTPGSTEHMPDKQ
jgi:hypothetical protein